MTYFGFLLRFLAIPILVLSLVAFRDWRQGRSRMATLGHWSALGAIVLHVAVALVYTTPWDNYLVATRVWWYDPELVTGMTLGWVPIEEYTFFILQPIFAGLWLWFIARRMDEPKRDLRPRLRFWSPALTGVLWLAAAIVLISGWLPGTYLALELFWALPPIALQLAFGGDILWRYRRVVLMAILPPTLYLSFADALAIGWGTWTINPAKSLNLFLGGVLPVEEFFFFLLTNVLVTNGILLIWAETSHNRFTALKRYLPHRLSKRLFAEADAL